MAADAAAVAIAQARELRGVKWYVSMKRYRRIADVVSALDTEIGHLKADGSEGARAQEELLRKIADRMRAHRGILYREVMAQGPCPDRVANV